MVNVPAAFLEGSSSTSTGNNPILFLTEDDGSSSLRAALLRSVVSAVVNEQRLGELAVGFNITTPALYNVTLTNADTEYSQALPTACRAVTIQARTEVSVRLAWVTGKVATPVAPYLTLKAGAVYTCNFPVYLAAATVYAASATAGTVLEIEAWS